MAITTNENDVCDWCGYPEPPIDAEGMERLTCTEEKHMAVGCDNCGACLHAGHRDGDR